MASYPALVDGKPPTISLKDYDDAEWADTTCLDHRNGAYVVCVMEDPSKVVALIAADDWKVLDTIFQSAHGKLALGDVTKQ